MPPLSAPPQRLHEAMRYAVLNGGKRVRAILVIATGEALQCRGRTPRTAGPCAVEFIHAYSLVHDDMPSMDDDDLRRGVPTCHRAFGEATRTSGRRRAAIAGVRDARIHAGAECRRLGARPFARRRFPGNGRGAGGRSRIGRTDADARRTGAHAPAQDRRSHQGRACGSVHSAPEHATRRFSIGWTSTPRCIGLGLSDPRRRSGHRGRDSNAWEKTGGGLGAQQADLSRDPRSRSFQGSRSHTAMNEPRSSSPPLETTPTSCVGSPGSS